MKVGCIASSAAATHYYVSFSAMNLPLKSHLSGQVPLAEVAGTPPMKHARLRPITPVNRLFTAIRLVGSPRFLGRPHESQILKPPHLPFYFAHTSPPSLGPLNRMVTVRLSSWILGLAFIGLPRLAQAQDVTSGTAIYGTGQAATDWTGGTIDSGATLRLDVGGTVSGDVTTNGTLQYNASGNLTISNTVTGTGTLSMTGTGILTLSGSNTYSGGTTLTAGTLALGSANAIGVGNLTVNGGTLDLKGFNVTAAALAGSSGGTITSSVAGAVTLTTASASDSTYAGVIQNGTGTMSLAKQGTGTLTLSGTNTFTGATTVDAGVLNIQNANALGTTAAGTSVTSGAALQIQGSITTAAEALT